MQMFVAMGEEKIETESIVSGRFKWEADGIKGDKVKRIKVKVLTYIN